MDDDVRAEIIQAIGRAAIEAMREVTPAMSDRMQGNLLAQYGGSDADEAKELVEYLDVDCIFMRGIDAARSERAPWPAMEPAKPTKGNRRPARPRSRARGAGFPRA